MVGWYPDQSAILGQVDPESVALCGYHDLQCILRINDDVAYVSPCQRESAPGRWPWGDGRCGCRGRWARPSDRRRHGRGRVDAAPPKGRIVAGRLEVDTRRFNEVLNSRAGECRIDGEHERGEARNMRTGHGRAAQSRILLVRAAPVAAVYPMFGVGIHGAGRIAPWGNNINVISGVAVGGVPIHVVHRPDGHHVIERSGILDGIPILELIARSRRDETPRFVRLVDGALQESAWRCAAQTQVDDPRPIHCCPCNTFRYRSDRAAAVHVQHFDRHQHGVPGYACNTETVVRHGSGDPGYVGAVTVIVARVDVVVDKVVAEDRLARKIRMPPIHAGINDRDHCAR